MPERVQGLGRRDVVQGPDISALANQPSRQLAQQGVRAPTRANVSQVGSGFKVLAEVAKLGGATMDKFLKDKADADFDAGEMLRVEGSTLQEVNAMGVSRAALSGYHALDVQTKINDFSTQVLSNIEQEDHKLTPDVFQAQLGATVAEMREELPDDDGVRTLFNDRMTALYGKLVQNHTTHNIDYVGAQAARSITDLLVSSTLSGDTGQIDTYVSNLSDLVPGVPEEQRLLATQEALQATLLEGSFILHDAVGGSTGMRKMGFTESSIASVKNSMRSAQNEHEVRLSSTIFDFNRTQTARIDAGASENDVLKSYQQFADTNHLDAAFQGVMYSKVINAVANRSADQDLYDKLLDPEVKAATSGLLLRIAATGLTVTTSAEIQDIATKFDLPKSMVKTIVTGAVKASELQDRDAKSAVQKELADKRKKDERDTRVNSWITSGYNQRISSTDAQYGAELVLDGITVATLSDPNMDTETKIQLGIDRTAAALVKFPLIVESYKNDFSVVAKSSPLLADNTISPEHEEAARRIRALRDAGMNENLIRKYAGESYDYLADALDLSNGSFDMKQALVSAHEINTGDASTEQRFNTSEVNDLATSVINDVLDKVEPWWIQGNSEGGSTYADVLTSDVDALRTATRNASNPIRQFVTRKTQVYGKLFPTASTEYISKRVRRDLASWEYVNGELIEPNRAGRSISNIMGIDTLPGRLNANLALISSIRERVLDTLPEDSLERTWLDTLNREHIHSFKNANQLTTSEFLSSVLGKAVGAVSPTAGAALGLLSDDSDYADALKGRTHSNKFVGFSEDSQRRANFIMPFSSRIVNDNYIQVQLFSDEGRSQPLGEPFVLHAPTEGSRYKDLIYNTGVLAAPDR